MKALNKPDVEAFIHAFESDPITRSKKQARKLVRILFNRFKDDLPAAEPPDLVDQIYDQTTKRKGKQAAPNIYVLRGEADRLLTDFSDRHRARFGFSVQISNSPYQLLFPEARAGEGRSVLRDQGSAFATFWEPYLNAVTRPVLIFTAPLFFRDQEYRYIRDINVNKESQRYQLDALLGAGSSETWIPVRHYYSAGEVNAALKIMTALQRGGSTVDYRVVSSEEQLLDRADASIIALGSGRTNWYIEALQAEMPFIVNRQDVIDSSDNPHKTYSDHTDPHGRLVKYAVLTRCAGAHQGMIVTLIGANNGRAAEGVANWIVHEADLAVLLRNICGPHPLPRSFQVLFEVLVRSELESQILKVNIVRTWAAPPVSEETQH